MGKKYIIEIEDDRNIIQTFGGKYTLAVSTRLGNVEGFIDTAIPVMPYTEPDLEQVRKEAYEVGFNVGRTLINTGKYEKGLNDAWEAARKIIHMPEGDLLNIFTECYSAVCTPLQVILKYDASEAIEKIRQYEQEKEQSFTTEEVMRQYLDTFCKGRSCTNCLLCTPDFTCGRGKHFLHNCVSDEEVRRAYAAVLAKMKES